MKALRRFLFGTTAILATLCAAGCASNAEEEEEDEGALGAEDSGKVIPTAQTDIQLFQGYNTAFDQATGGCVTFPDNLTPAVGDVGVDLKISLVNTREELAKQLGFDTNLGFKLPSATGDARAQVINSFKRSASTTTLLVRVGTYYFVDAGQTFTLTPEAQRLLETDVRGFVQKCGDTVVTRLQYRAEVIGLMKFDTNDKSKSTKSTVGAGAEAPVAGVAEAKGKVEVTAEQMRQSTGSELNLELYTQGFGPGGDIALGNLHGTAALEKLGELLKKMADQVAHDRASDFEAAKAGRLPVQAAGAPPRKEGEQRGAIARGARLNAIVFHSYAKSQSTSQAPLIDLTENTRRFLLESGTVQGKLENIYFEEVNAFLTATDQEKYNLIAGPMNTSQELVPVAQKWAELLKPEPVAGTISGKLKDAQLQCVRYGIAGDFSKCQKTAELATLLEEGRKQIGQYAQEGRIVRMNIVYGADQELTVDNAQTACKVSGGRLPMDTEMPHLRPALALKGGFAWVRSQACPKGIGIYTGAQQANCYNGWYMDWYDGLLDATGLSKRAASVFCVANNGPVPQSQPGE